MSHFLMRARLKLRAEPASVSQSRRWLEEVCASFVSDLDDARLLLSELVSNGVRHGGRDITVIVEVDEILLRLQVSDGGSGAALAVQDQQDVEEGGRGLFLVEQLAESWGWDQYATETRVWCTLATAPGPGPTGGVSQPRPRWRSMRVDEQIVDYVLADDDVSADGAFSELAEFAATLTDSRHGFVTLTGNPQRCWTAGPDETWADRRDWRSLLDALVTQIVHSDGPVSECAVYLSDAQDQLSTREAPVERLSARTWAGHPIRGAGGRIVGAIGVFDTRDRSFTREHLAALRALAASGGRELTLRSSAASGQAFADVAEAAVERLRRQSRASTLLSASLDPFHVLQVLGALVVPAAGSWVAVAMPADAADGVFGRFAPAGSDAVAVIDVVHEDPTQEAPLLELLRALPISKTDRHGAGRVLATGEAELLFDRDLTSLRLAGDPKRSVGEALVAFSGDVDGVLTLPLRSGGRVFAAMSVACPRGGDLDRELLADIAQRAGSALDNALVYARQQRLGLELQRSLTPTDPPPALPGARLAARYLPSMVGALACGDFHQVIRRSGDVVLVLGDVEGHGMTSAARMGQLRAAVAALALQDHDPSDLLSLLARDTDQILAISLATLLVASFDSDSRRLTVASAGHPPPLVATGREARYIDLDPGPPLGTGRASFAQVSLDLEPGGVVVLYSDGLIERRGESLTDGMERLRLVALQARAATDDVEQLADLLLVGTGCADGSEDDIALMVLQT